MKVCLLVGSGNPSFGGVERHVIQVANGVVDHGHSAFLVMGHPCPIDAEHGLRPGVVVHRVPVPDGRSFPAFARAALRCIQHEGPSVVHSHLTYGLGVGAWARTLKGHPLVHTEHFLVRKSGDEGLRGRIGAVLRGRADALIFVSRMVLDGCAVAGDRPTRHVIYNGADPIDPPPTWHPSRRLVYLGRLDADKRVAVALDAIRLLSGEGYVLDVVGTGLEEKALQGAAGDLVTSGVVRFHGWQRDVGRFLEGAGALLLPAREGLGYSAIEAAAYGVPVVAPAASGAAEVVERSGRGALVDDDGRPEAWANAVRGLAWLPETRVEFPTILQRAHMVEETIRVYRGLWDRHPRTA